MNIRKYKGFEVFVANSTNEAVIPEQVNFNKLIPIIHTMGEREAIRYVMAEMNISERKATVYYKGYAGLNRKRKSFIERLFAS